MHTQTLIQWQNSFHFIEFLNVTFRYFVEAVLGTAVHTGKQNVMLYLRRDLILFCLHKTKTTIPKPYH